MTTPKQEVVARCMKAVLRGLENRRKSLTRELEKIADEIREIREVLHGIGSDPEEPEVPADRSPDAS